MMLSHFAADNRRYEKYVQRQYNLVEESKLFHNFCKLFKYEIVMNSQLNFSIKNIAWIWLHKSVNTYSFI